MIYAEQARRQGFISDLELDWLISISDDGDKRSGIEKILGYKKHTGGVLGKLDDLFAVIETALGYRFFVSTAAAVTEGLKEKGSWGLAFSTQEFKRAWSGELSPSGRTSYRDILFKGGSDWMVKGATGLLTTFVCDVFLDPATYITCGASAGMRVSLSKGTAQAALKAATKSSTIPGVLTLSRWGDKVYQTAAKELVETQPRTIQRMISYLDHGDPNAFKQGGLMILSPTDISRAQASPSFRSAVANYMVENYDRLALRTAGFEEQAAGLAGKGEILSARINVRRGPGALFQEWAGKSIGAYMTEIRHGGVEGLFDETKRTLQQQLSLRHVGRVAAAGEAALGLATLDAGMVGSAFGTLLAAETPALALKTIKKVSPTSAIRFLDRNFRSAIERLPAEDAAVVQSIKNGAALAVTAKESELHEFFSSAVAEGLDAGGKVVRRKLDINDAEVISRHLDNPALNLIEEGSELYKPMKWCEDQFDLIWQQEHEVGLVGESWEDYVTHYYGSRNAGAVAKFYRDSNKTRRLVASLDREHIPNRNSFALHRIIATFDDAEQVFGKDVREIMDLDVGSILSRRWSASIRIQAKMRANQYLYNKHGISALGEGFRNAHSALSEMASKFGALARSYIDLGPPHRASSSEIRRLARSMCDVKPVKNADWFSTAEKVREEIAERLTTQDIARMTADFDNGPKGLLYAEELNRVRTMAANLPIDPAARGKDRIVANRVEKAVAEFEADFGKGRESALYKSEVARIRAEYDEFEPPPIEMLETAIQRNIDILNKIAKQSLKKPIRDFSVGELEALRDYLNLSVVKNARGLQQYLKIGRMNNLHRLALVQVGPTSAGIRPISIAHRITREVPDYSSVELRRFGRKIAKQSGVVADDATLLELGRKAAATLKPQRPKLMRDVMEAGFLEAAERKAADAVEFAAESKSLLRSIPRDLRKKIAASFTINDRLDEATKELGEGTAKNAAARKVLVDAVQAAEQRTSAALSQRVTLHNTLNRGSLRTSRAQVAPGAVEGLVKAVAEIDGTIKREFAALREARAAFEKFVGDDLSKMETRVRRLQSERFGIAEAITGQTEYIERWLHGKVAAVGAKEAKKAAKDLRTLYEAERKLGARQDILLTSALGKPGLWYVPEVWVDAINEAFTAQFNPAQKLDRLLAGWQRFQLLWKIPLCLPFFEHHGRNFITNVFLTAGYTGIRMLNPKNWIDCAAVAGIGLSRVLGKEGKEAQLLSKQSSVDILKQADLLTPFHNHKIKDVVGRFYLAGEVYREAVIRGVTHGFTMHEVDGVNAIFGGLFRGRMIPNIGLMRAATDRHLDRARNTMQQTMKEEGVIGGAAAGGARITLSALEAVKDSMYTGARWASRKAEQVIDVPFRLAVFTDAVKRGRTFDEAAEDVRRHLNDWSRLSPFERKYMRTLIPFYSWVQFSMERFFRDIVTNVGPGLLNPTKLIRAAQNAMSSEPPGSQYQSDWMADRLGIWDENGEKLYRRYMLNGLNADEAMRQVAALTEFANLMGHKLSRAVGADALAWTVFAPDSNPKDDLRFLSQLDFTTVATIEGMRGRDLIQGTPTGTVPEIMEAEGYSKYERADWLVHPSTREKLGSKVLRRMLDVDEINIDDPKHARATAWRRWLIGKTPVSRVVSVYERNQRQIVQAIEGGNTRSLGQRTFDAALELLGTRAYAFDPKTQKMYYYRDRIEAVQRVLTNAGYMDVYRKPYVPKKH
jgi:hypothetical protein